MYVPYVGVSDMLGTCGTMWYHQRPDVQCSVRGLAACPQMSRDGFLIMLDSRALLQLRCCLGALTLQLYHLFFGLVTPATPTWCDVPHQVGVARP